MAPRSRGRGGTFSSSPAGRTARRAISPGRTRRPAIAVDQLAAQVVAPVVTYQGEEVPPGEVFFPESCDPSLIRSSVDWRTRFTRGSQIQAQCARVQGVGRLLLIVDLMKIEDDYAIAYGWSLYYKMAEGCGLTSARADDDFQLGLFLSQGGLLLTNTIPARQWMWRPPWPRRRRTSRGRLYPATIPTATRRSSRPTPRRSTVQPVTGAPLNLQPRPAG